MPVDEQPIYQPPDRELASGSLTVDYLAAPFSRSLFWNFDRPWFTLFQAEAMLLDQQVWFGLQLRNAPLLQAKVEVKGPSPEVASFAQKQWDRFWQRSAHQVVATKYFGYAGFEVLYCDDDGTEFEGLKDFHPYDVRPMIQRQPRPAAGRIAGVGVHGQRKTPSGEPPQSSPTRLYGMKGLWLNHNPLYASNFGRAATEKAYPAWWDKTMPGGGYALRRLRAVKDAWIGDVIKYPIGKQFVLPDGTKISGKDIAKEIGELRASGGAIVIPSDVDPLTQKPYFDYLKPESITDSGVVKQWIDDADWDIFDGLLVPREVVEAAASGSGFSGRSIPMIMFLAMGDAELFPYVQAFKQQVLEPLVIRRFGKAANKFELKPVPLIETFAEKMGGQQTGGPIGGTTAQNGYHQGSPDGRSVPPRLMHLSGEAMQFAADGAHEFSSIQVNVASDVRERVLAMAAQIEVQDLAEDGRETEPHITVLFGLHADNAEDVRAIVESTPPIIARLGSTSLFESENYDVVKIDIESPSLHELHELLASLPHTDTHPTYQPHLTLGYVKSGMGQKYAGRGDLAGTLLVFGSVLFSDKQRNKIEIPLLGSTIAMQFATAEEAPGTTGKRRAAGRGLDDFGRTRDQVLRRLTALLKKN